MKAPLHKRAHRAIVSAHARHLSKIQHAAKHSRTFCEIATAVFTSVETHMSAFAYVCVTWAIIDVVLLVLKADE